MRERGPKSVTSFKIFPPTFLDNHPKKCLNAGTGYKSLTAASQTPRSTNEPADLSLFLRKIIVE